MANSTYTEIITRAIQNFDAIYDAIRAKLVSNDTTVLTAGNKTDGTVPTSAYAGYINQLYRVGTANSEGTTINAITPVLVNGVIQYYTGNVNASTVVEGTPTATAIPVTLGIANPGYYDTNATVTGQLPYADITVTTSNIAGFASGDTYVVKNLTAGTPNNIPMLNVTMAHGAIGVSYASNAQTVSGEALNETLTINSADSTVVGATKTQTAGYYKVSTTIDASYIASGSIAPTVSFTPGYIVDSDVTGNIATPTFSIESHMPTQTEDIYIPNGTITGYLGPNAAVAINADTTLDLSDETPSSGSYYTLTATTAGLDVLADTNHGYVVDNTGYKIGTVENKTKNYYIKAGTVPDTNVVINPATEITYSDTGNLTSSTATGYSINVGVQKDPITQTITKGFVADPSYDVTISSGSGKNIYINSGHITNNAAVNQKTVTGRTDVIVSGAGGSNDYAIDIPVYASITTRPLTTSGDSAGYISNLSTQVTNNSSSDTHIQYHVAHGSASISTTLSATLTDVSGDGDGSVTNEVMFDTDQPDSGDYYTITAHSAKSSVTPGYMLDGDISLSADDIFYLKKATFQYVEMGDQERSFLQVVNGGYVPSGLIADIASISGSPDAAAVTVALSGTGSILKTATTTGLSYYTISASKGSVNAGYISSQEGTLSGEAYVLHGSINLKSDITGTTLDSISNLDAQTQKYTLTLVNSLTNSVSDSTDPFREGYIKQGDITLNGTANVTTKTLTDNTTITLDRGIFGITAKSIALNIQKDSNIEVVESGGYAINPIVSSGSITVDATTDGYVKAGDSQVTTSVTNSDTDITKTGIQIKKGTGATNSNWTVDSITSTATLTPNFNDTVAGDYTVTLGGTANAALTLDTGYYGNAEKALSGTKGGTVNLNKTLTVAHGKSTVNLSTDTNNLTGSSGINSYLYAAGAVSGTAEEDYVSVTSAVTMHTTTTITAGYVKDINGDKQEDTESAGSTRYLKTLKATGIGTTTSTYTPYNGGGSAVTTATTVYGAYSIGSRSGIVDGAVSSYATSTDTTSTNLRDSLVIPSKGTVALYDTKIELTPNAMGTSVRSKLEDLLKRLDGLAVA